MRYIKLLLFVALPTLHLSCSKEKDIMENNPNVTITASYTEKISKTTLQDGGTRVLWEPGDEIKVFFEGEGSRFVSTLDNISTTSNFSGSLNFGTNGKSGGKSLLAVYPYNSNAISDGHSITTVLPSEQIGKVGSFARSMNISLAQSNSFNMSFYNVCGGVRFSLTHEGVTKVVLESLNSDEPLAGCFKTGFEGGVPVIQDVMDSVCSVTLTAPGGGTFEVGKWYYIMALPCTLKNGFKMTFNTEKQLAVFKSPNIVSIKRSCFESLPDVDDGLAYYDKNAPAPRFSEAVELICLIFRLAGASEYNGCNITPVSQSADIYFEKMKTHKAVSLAQEYHKKGVAYDAVTAFGIHLLISDDGQITFNPDFVSGSSTSFDRWTSQQKSDMLIALNDFYRESDFHCWYTSFEDLRSQAIEAFINVCNIDYNWFDQFYGPIEKLSRQIILSFFIGSHNNGLSVTLTDGTFLLTPVMGSAKYLSSGKISYSSGLYQTIIHEFSHPYCNPLISNYWGQISSTAAAVYATVKEQMKDQAYDSAQTMMNETLVRSSVIRYIDSHYGNELAENRIKYDESKGFTLVRRISDVMKEKENNIAQYPTLNSFMPVIVTTINTD